MDRIDTTLVSVALLALEVGASGEPPEWIQLTPVSQGTFVGVDGRKFTLQDAQGVATATLARGAMRIDINHGTQLAAKSGFEAPAAAWIDQILLHGPKGQPGLWGHVEHWTPKGAQSVKDREYKFVSPELQHDTRTGRVLSIKGAALTNDPALVMTSLFHNQETTDLSKKLRTALGLPDTATDDEVLTAVTNLSNANTAMCAREKLLMTAANLTGTALDDTMTTALCTKLKTPAATGDASEVALLSAKVAELTERVLTLTTKDATQSAASAVDAAIKAGKLTPAQREDALDLCSRDPARFAKFVDKSPTILAGGRVAPDGVAEGALTTEELALCSKLNIKPEDFTATKKAQEAVS